MKITCKENLHPKTSVLEQIFLGRSFFSCATNPCMNQSEIRRNRCFRHYRVLCIPA